MGFAIFGVSAQFLNPLGERSCISEAQIREGWMFNIGGLNFEPISPQISLSQHMNLDLVKASKRL